MPPEAVLDREIDAFAMFEAIFPAPNKSAPIRSTGYAVVAPKSRTPKAVKRNDPTTNDTLLQPRGIAASDSADTSFPTPITLFTTPYATAGSAAALMIIGALSPVNASVRYPGIIKRASTQCRGVFRMYSSPSLMSVTMCLRGIVPRPARHATGIRPMHSALTRKLNASR